MIWVSIKISEPFFDLTDPDRSVEYFFNQVDKLSVLAYEIDLCHNWGTFEEKRESSSMTTYLSESTLSS
jgi:hypothetical protein